MITTSRPPNLRNQAEAVEPAVAGKANNAAPGSHLAAPRPHLGPLAPEGAREVPAAEEAKAKGKAKERVREATSRPVVPIAR